MAPLPSSPPSFHQAGGFPGASASWSVSGHRARAGAQRLRRQPTTQMRPRPRVGPQQGAEGQMPIPVLAGDFGSNIQGPQLRDSKDVYEGLPLTPPPPTRSPFSQHLGGARASLPTCPYTPPTPHPPPPRPAPSLSSSPSPPTPWAFPDELDSLPAFCLLLALPLPHILHHKGEPWNSPSQ